jgi:4-hydroxybenzoate polyprenyltransferase
MAFLRLIRFQNLFIVALTQVLLYHWVLLPAYEKHEISPRLEPYHFYLFVMVTLLLAASGFIINDIYDLPTDQVNRPKRVLVQQLIPLQVAYWLYANFSMLGFLLALYLAFYVVQVELINIYWIASLFLFWYTHRLKKEPLLGNILVALLCAGVTASVWLAEAPQIHQLMLQAPIQAAQIKNTFLWYCLFAFFSTLFREIVKDLEDENGDRQTGARTLPIVFGEKTAKQIAIFTGILLLALLFWQWAFAPVAFKLYFYLLEFLLVGCPMLISFFLLYKANQPKAYRQVSLIAKIIIINGILLLLFSNG